MALDQVKTQVLILHSEQNALDNLSAVIDDRYTVHCATSGSEALQTLGETPIHIIISAQHLPGMSGVEALREAKKRSPETVGILLAGSANDDGLGALVGEQEVFQVVRGGISESDLNRLISEATQQMRLLALAESANDGAANPDEPVAEHIVMETSENGSAMISDGTGSWSTLPLDEEGVDGAAEPSPVDVLVLSKDRDFLTTVQESSRATHIVRAVNTLAQAEQALAKHAIGVAVVDAAMAGTRVEKLTEHLQSKKQRLVCIVAGRRDDGEMLMDLINRGKVYRFLLKPVSPGRARLAVEASVKHHLEAPDSAFEPGHVAATPIVRRIAGKESADRPMAPQTSPPEVIAAADRPGSRESDTNPATEADSVSTAAPVATTAAGVLAASGIRERVSGKLADGRAMDENGTDSRTVGGTATGEIPEPAIAHGEPASGTRVAGRRPWLGMAIFTGIAVLAGVGYFLARSADTPPSAVTVQESPSPDTASIEPAPSPEPAPAIVATGLLAVAEDAMLEKRLADARAALDEVRRLDPEHARLPFLTAQVAQMQLRANIDDTRAAIRESRFEDAAAALLAARALDTTGTPELDAVAEELSSAQSEQRTDELLARAAASIDADRLISPNNDNARHYFELALSNEPDNAAARQGLKVIAGKLVLHALHELDQYRFDEAERLLGEARGLDPTSADIATSAEALADARDRIIEDQRREENARRAKTRAEAQRLAALQEGQARPGGQAMSADDRDSDDAAPATTPAGPAATNELAERLPSAGPPPGGGTAGADFVPGNLVEALPSPLQSASVSPLKSPVAVSSLTRTRYVAPKYPRGAERRNQAGWVDVVFTVAVDGSTKNIEIKDSQPGDVFVNSATRAVEKWEFEPVLENGEAVERRANVRMMFAIE